MHPNVTEAVARLQKRMKPSSGGFTAEQTEQALNLLLNNPDNPAPPDRQIRNAMSAASRKLINRQRLLEGREWPAGFGPSGGSGLEWLLRIELDDFLDRMTRRNDGMLLRLAMGGSGAELIAGELGIPLERARERLSRARTRAIKLWLN